MFGLLLARDVTSPTRLVQNIEYINSAQLLFYEFYETQPWCGINQPRFYGQALGNIMTFWKRINETGN